MRRCNICFVFFASVLTTVVCSTTRYSFQLSYEWGALSPSNGPCCPHLSYPSNVTSSKSLLPRLIGLGVMKGGSTTLNWFIKGHPRMVDPRKKETNFFAEENKDYCLRDYEAFWNAETDSNSLLFEFTPHYLWIPMVACRIKRVLSDSKFVAIFRNPVDRAYSHFNMIRATSKGTNEMTIWKRVDYYTFIKDSIQKLTAHGCAFNNGEGDKTWNDCFGCVALDFSARKRCAFRPYLVYEAKDEAECLDFGEEVISRGLYAAQLAWWFGFFLPDNFVLINSHEFFNDPVTELNKLRKVLGDSLDPYEEWMLPNRQRPLMKGSYKYPDERKAEAHVLLEEFYNRPNEELYELLKETGHEDFGRFEKQRESEDVFLTQGLISQTKTIANLGKIIMLLGVITTAGLIFMSFNNGRRKSVCRRVNLP